MRILLIAIIAIAGIITAYIMTKPSEEKSLPVINPIDVNAEMVERDLVRQGFGHKIGEFSFTDQNNKAFGLKDVKGKVFVAEYFFTNCGTICPRMTEQMERIQNRFRGNTHFEILSFTVDPENDTVGRMAEYAKMHQADNTQWHFLTGKREDLYHVARRSFFVLKPAEAQNQGDVGSDFIHTNNFVLVDQQQRIRGYYDGTSEEDVNRLMHDIGHLLAGNGE
jgi:protein SCO1